MTGNAGTKAAKAAGRAYDASRARAKAVKALEASWVLGGELTAEQLVAERDRLRAECMARHPEWFAVAA